MIMDKERQRKRNITQAINNLKIYDKQSVDILISMLVKHNRLTGDVYQNTVSKIKDDKLKIYFKRAFEKASDKPVKNNQGAKEHTPPILLQWKYIHFYKGYYEFAPKAYYHYDTVKAKPLKVICPQSLEVFNEVLPSLMAKFPKIYFYVYEDGTIDIIDKIKFQTSILIVEYQSRNLESVNNKQNNQVMNKATRKQIAIMSIELEAIKKRLEEIGKVYGRLKDELDGFQEKLESYQSDIEGLADEERMKFDNLPEGLQESERGEAYEIAADTLEEAASNLEEVVSSLTEKLGDWVDIDVDEITSGIDACIESLGEIE